MLIFIVHTELSADTDLNTHTKSAHVFNIDILPGHELMLQIWESIFEVFPTHCLPPYAGAGLVHVRVLFLDCVPPSHVASQRDHALHCP